MLEGRGLSAGYGHLQVLRGVDVDIVDGEVVALIGANGAGKTTLLRTLTGLVATTAGHVHYRGAPVHPGDTARLAREGLRFVPSERRLFPGMTVRENLLLGAHPDRVRSHDLARVTDLFPRLGERWGQQAGTLSGGEQQMVAIGRALVGRPALLVLDEPTTGLAPRLAAEVYAALAVLRRTEGTTILAAEQQLPRVLELADRGIVLERGQVRSTGTAAQLAADPAVRRAYLGVG